MDSVGRGGTDAVKIRNKLSMNGSVGKVSFHHAEFALGAFFPSIKLNLLALYRLEFALMHSISVDVSDNTGIFEIDDSIVDEKSGSGGGVENIEVVVFNPRAIEIGGRMCMCVEGNRELRVATFVSSYKMSVDPNLPEGDIACHLVLPILVEENKWVLPRITVVILAPPISWMVWVVELFSELGDGGDGARCR